MMPEVRMSTMANSTPVGLNHFFCGRCNVVQVISKFVPDFSAREDTQRKNLRGFGSGMRIEKLKNPADKMRTWHI
jgi:hypothetical protein